MNLQDCAKSSPGATKFCMLSTGAGKVYMHQSTNDLAMSCSLVTDNLLLRVVAVPCALESLETRNVLSAVWFVRESGTGAHKFEAVFV